MKESGISSNLIFQATILLSGFALMLAGLLFDAGGITLAFADNVSSNASADDIAPLDLVDDASLIPAAPVGLKIRGTVSPVIKASFEGIGRFSNTYYVQNGIGEHIDAYFLWGWACEIGKTQPVAVKIFFKDDSGTLTHWKTVNADQKGGPELTSDPSVCAQTLSYRYALVLSYAELVRFEGQKAIVRIKDSQEVWHTAPATGNANISVPAVDDIALTPNGWINGREDPYYGATVSTFRGIPYATPPTSTMRWKPSVPLSTKWFDLKPMIDYSDSCMQDTDQAPQSENCLTLNVSRPKKQYNRPVVVYIHGGGFKEGSSKILLYNGSYLASQGIVFVSINYRVGIFGFFSHPLLRKWGGANSTGNFALMDQELAIQWVHDNIEWYGGDPNNVTIVGSSAGGSSVGYWLTSDRGHGLFQRAVMESGGGSVTRYLVPISASDSSRSADARGEELIKILFDGRETLSGLPKCFIEATSYAITENEDCMGQVFTKSAAQTILEQAGTTSWGSYTTGSWHPFKDDYYVTGGILDRLHAGLQKPLPLIVGSVDYEAHVREDEIFNAQTPEDLSRFYFGIDPQELAQVYGIDDFKALARAVYADKTFGVPARVVARKHSAKQPRTYRYYFTYQLESKRPTEPNQTWPEIWYGAPHHIVTANIFNSLALLKNYNPQPNDLAVSKIWSDLLISFARGDELVHSADVDSHSEDIVWPNYDATNDTILYHESFSLFPNSESNMLKKRYDYIENKFLKGFS